jgi:uncharacterized protein DUF2760
MDTQISFVDRLKLAWRVLMDATLAGRVARLASEPEAEKKPSIPPERLHASALVLLAALQREGRFVDFVRQDVAGFSDEDVGAAARVVHDGCAKVLAQFFEFEPAAGGLEGAPASAPAGFDAQRIRLTGNLTGQPPFKGTLKHHGWVATAVRMPAIAETLDARVVAPAEIELP